MSCHLQEVVPAHLATSPIPTEGHMFWIGEGRGQGAGADELPEADDPPEAPVNSTGSVKKKRKRRKKHKGDPRREEMTPPAAVTNPQPSEEIFEMDLSSDEETATHSVR